MFRLSLVRRARRLALALVPVLAILAVAAPAAAGQPQPMALYPAPPDGYDCRQTGGGTVCTLVETVVLEPESTGLVCSSPAGSFEIFDEATRTLIATRTYDRDGNLVKRVRVNDFSDAQLSNPSSGGVIGYIQRDRDVDVFTVPGDLSSSTFTSTGSLTAVVPGMGAVLVERGRVEVSPDGELTAFTGRRDLAALFEGDEEILARVCEALAG
jgi:hypothetical protein